MNDILFQSIAIAAVAVTAAGAARILGVSVGTLIEAATLLWEAEIWAEIPNDKKTTEAQHYRIAETTWCVTYEERTCNSNH